jgi:hypothetical protein
MPITIKGLPGLMLRRPEASRHLLTEWGLSYSANTLARMASDQRGPPYRRLGKHALYPVEELNAWAQGQLGPLLNAPQAVTKTPQPRQRAHAPKAAQQALEA